MRRSSLTPPNRSGSSPSEAAYNLRGSAYYDKGEYDIAIADFDDALRIGPPSAIIYHNRGNAWRGKGDHARPSPTTIRRSGSARRGVFLEESRDFETRRSAISTARWPTSTRRSGSTRHCRRRLISRAVIWRAKGDIDRAIADATEAIPLAQARTPANVMTPPGSVLISAFLQRALAYEVKGDFAREGGF